MKRYLVIITILLSICSVGKAQVVTTEGRDFWLAFLPNYSPGSLSLIISGQVATTGTVSISGTSWTQTFSVTPGVVTNVTIPSTYELSSNETVGQYAVHVTSRAKISLYASNYMSATYDITNVLPTNALQNKYVLQTFGVTLSNNEFCIVATENNTVVNIRMSASSTGSLTPTQTSSVTLQRGNTYLVRSQSDISGTTVWTNDCKPFAVFVGNVCAQVPNGCAYCDHLYEQAIPKLCWGRKFGVTTSKTRTLDILKVTAASDSTIVSWGDSTFMLNALQSRTITLNSSTSPGFYLEGSKPLLVYLYLSGSTCGGTNGDPSVTIIHPIEQQVSSITFSTFNTSIIDSHYVNIVTKTAYANNIFLDGTRIATTQFNTLSGNNNYSYARLSVTNGSHTISSPGGAFVAHIYGLGLAESYSYAAGASIDPINPRLFLNNVSFSLYDSTNNMFCPSHELRFSAEVLAEGSSVVTWMFGDGGSAVGLNATHSYSQPGDYMVSVMITVIDEDCYQVTTRRDSMYVHINEQPTSVTDTVVCDSVCRWNGRQYDSAGLYSVSMPSGGLCDSIAKLDIKAMLLPPHPSIEFDYNCDEHLCHLSAVGEGDYYRWSCTPYNYEITGHLHDDNITVTPNTTRTYKLYMAYMLDSLCGHDTTLVIHEIGTMKASPVATPTMADYDNSTIILKDNTPDAVGRHWYAIGSEIGNTQTIEYSYPIYLDSVIITLDAYNMYDCHDTASLIIRFMTEGIYVPNVITPARRDNTFFQVVGSSLMDGEIWIFNRQGVLLWYSDNINERWYGTKQDGTPLPQGTYVYLLRYRKTPEPDIWIRKKGTVTVIK